MELGSQDSPGDRPLPEPSVLLRTHCRNTAVTSNSPTLAKRPFSLALPLRLLLTSTPVRSLQELSLGSHPAILSGPEVPGTSEAWAWEDRGCFRSFSPEKGPSGRTQGPHPVPSRCTAQPKAPAVGQRTRLPGGTVFLFGHPPCGSGPLKHHLLLCRHS